MIDPHDEDYDADLEECIDWQLTYRSSGRSRQVLIDWLTARPQDSLIISGEIIEFLQTRRDFLDDDKTPLSTLSKEDIYSLFKTGNYLGFRKIEGWDTMPYKLKIYEISKLFSEYEGKEGSIRKIIHEQKSRQRHR
jgi:hypothetical protein